MKRQITFKNLLKKTIKKAPKSIKMKTKNKIGENYAD